MSTSNRIRLEPRPRPRSAACWGAGLLVLLGGCTEFEAGSDTLTTSTNGLTPEPPAGEDWRCVTPASIDASEAELVMAADEAQRLVQPLQFLTLGPGEVPTGARVRACSLADVDCVAPLTDDYSLSPEGWVNLPLRRGFNGYIEIRGDAILPTMVFLGEPLVRPRPTDYPIALVERRILPGISGATGTMQSESSGLLALRAFDCQDVAASGVSFSQQREGVPWYFVDGLPSSLATATGPEGLGGFINTPPGTSVITTTGRDGRPVASRKSVSVRADWMTALRMWVGEEATP